MIAIWTSALIDGARSVFVGWSLEVAVAVSGVRLVLLFARCKTWPLASVRVLCVGALAALRLGVIGAAAVT